MPSVRAASPYSSLYRGRHPDLPKAPKLVIPTYAFSPPDIPTPVPPISAATPPPPTVPVNGQTSPPRWTLLNTNGLSAFTEWFTNVFQETVQGVGQIQTVATTVWRFLPPGVKVLLGACVIGGLWKTCRGKKGAQVQKQEQQVIVQVPSVDYEKLGEAIAKRLLTDSIFVEFLDYFGLFSTRKLGDYIPCRYCPHNLSIENRLKRTGKSTESEPVNSL